MRRGRGQQQQEQLEQGINLGALLRERAQEKRRESKEKAKRGREIIKGKRKFQNVGVFPEETFQKFESNGIWERVLRLLTDRSDITSAYLTCRKFSEYLEERRKKPLFPEVFQILWNNRYLSYVEGTKPQEKRNLLNLRLVCKNWKDLVDARIFDEEKFYHDSSHCNWLRSMRDPRLNVFKNVKLDMVDKAIEKLDKDSSVIKFFCIMQSDNYYANNEKFVTKIKKLLKKCGPSVRNFMYRYEDASTFETWYTLFMTLLPMMPNITTLRVEPCPTSREWNKELLRLKLIELPFPEMPSVEYFIVSQYGKEEALTPLIVQILNKCENLKNVRHDYFAENKNDEMAGALANLDLERYRCFNNSFAQSSTILSRAAWPALKLLTLDLGKWSRAKCSELFALLNRFSDSLEDLTLNGMDTVEDDGANLELARLKRLHIVKQNSSMNLDRFILLKTVEQMELEFSYSQNPLVLQQSFTEMVEVTGYVELMEYSNIWKLYPDLREVIVNTFAQKYTYTRRGRDVSRSVKKVVFQF